MKKKLVALAPVQPVYKPVKVKKVLSALELAEKHAAEKSRETGRKYHPIRVNGKYVLMIV